MTKKDFQTIADAIQTAPGLIDDVFARKAVAAHFAEFLAESNERFDADRFIEAATKTDSAHAKALRAERGY